MADSNYLLTTYDNPYNPFTQFSDWFLFDEQKGYHTVSYLGRVAKTSDALTQEENEQEVKNAIDGIIAADPFGIYCRAFEPKS